MRNTYRMHAYKTTHEDWGPSYQVSQKDDDPTAGEPPMFSVNAVHVALEYGIRNGKNVLALEVWGAGDESYRKLWPLEEEEAALATFHALLGTVLIERNTLLELGFERLI